MGVFFDTNVLVYCTDVISVQKQARARTLVAENSAAGEAVVSTQVLIELFNALTRKQSMPAETAQTLTLAYAKWPVIQSDAALVSLAIEKSIQHRLSIWDALVIEAAIRAGAHTLYTEDLTHGQRFESLTITNPFLQ
jgi:predicted nucleic acid-binding protein